MVGGVGMWRRYQWELWLGNCEGEGNWQGSLSWGLEGQRIVMFRLR